MALFLFFQLVVEQFNKLADGKRGSNMARQ
jgi:hypothetical protein